MDGIKIGNGSIGGKGNGFLQAKGVLAGKDDELSRLRFPKTCFLTTEVFDKFREINGFEKLSGVLSSASTGRY